MARKLHTFTPPPGDWRGDQLLDEIEAAMGWRPARELFYRSAGLDVEIEAPDPGEETPIDWQPVIDAVQAVISASVYTYPYTPEEVETEVQRTEGATAQARLLASVVANKTPTEIYDLVEARLTAATTAAEMRTQLIQIIPMIAMLAAYTARKEGIK